jgi:alpha-ketoglutarate-dependent taurine dioxygenase
MLAQEIDLPAIRPMDAALGAVVENADLSRPLDRAGFEVVRQALDRHLVLLFRGQSLTDQNLVDFSRLFGELDPPAVNPYGETLHKVHPEINIISNVSDNGKPIGNLGAGEAVWHADMTYLDNPPKAAVLYSLEIPSSGGATYFANMFAAYEALDDDMKTRIEGKVAIHDAAHNSAGMLRKGYTEVEDVRQTPGARHPLVRTQPGTGRKALFLGRRPRSYVPGLSVADSDALLDALWAHAAQERFTIRHDWQVGDALMWSNLWVLHRRDAFDNSARRIMHRTQIRGD